MKKQDWTPRTMTFDEVLNEVNQGWGWSYLGIGRQHGGWVAYWEHVDVRGSVSLTQEQPWFSFDTAAGAVEMLIRWFRGKKIRHSAMRGGVPGEWVDVPVDLEPPSL